VVGLIKKGRRVNAFCLVLVIIDAVLGMTALHDGNYGLSYACLTIGFLLVLNF